MKQIIYVVFLCLPCSIFAQVLTNTTNLDIIKTWTQEPNGFSYPVNILVPQGVVPQDGFPVCILLHGNGGNGPGMIAQLRNTLACHILIAPTGYQNTWNICDEISNGPDIEMMNDLVNTLQTYSNINANKIRILGVSNGAGLANRVFIENKNTGIDIICAIVSQLNESQYHLDNFYQPKAETDINQNYCGYDSLAMPVLSRKYLSICNDNDMLIPYSGGTSAVGVNFLAAEEAAFKIAGYKGFSGTQISGNGIAIGTPTIYEFSYLSDDVVHIKGDAGHAMNETQKTYIKAYFSDCTFPTTVNKLESTPTKIYPNPFAEIFRIERMTSEAVSLSVFNVLGKSIMVKHVDTQNVEIDLSNFPNGIYLIKIDNEVFKLMKQ